LKPETGSSAMTRLLPGIVGATAMAACAPVPPAQAGSPLVGSWGGQHVGLVIGPSGGTVDYDCAAGRIDGPLSVGRNGRFSGRGSHTPGTGGPERVGEVRPSYPAVYSGSVSGGWMTFRVDVPEPAIVIGPYRLRRGAEPMLMRCL
jgi:hypothetical protein